MSHIFYVEVDLEWRCLFSFLTQNGEVCSALASRCSHSETGHYFYELHVAETCDDGQDFSPLSAAFFGLLFGVEARRYRVMPIHLDILQSTHPVSEHASDTATTNNINNDTIWRGSVLTGEEPPPHSGELKHALSQGGGPTQSQLSRLCRQDTTSPWSTDYGGNN